MYGRSGIRWSGSGVDQQRRLLLGLGDPVREGSAENQNEQQLGHAAKLLA